MNEDDDYNRKVYAIISRASAGAKKTTDESFAILAKITMEKITDPDLVEIVLYNNDSVQVYIDLGVNRSRSPIGSWLLPSSDDNPALAAIKRGLERLGPIGTLIVAFWLVLFPPAEGELAVTAATRWLRKLGGLGSVITGVGLIVRLPSCFRARERLKARYDLPGEDVSAKGPDNAA